MQGKGGSALLLLLPMVLRMEMEPRLVTQYLENLLHHLPGTEVTLGFMAHSFYNI